MNTLKMMFSGGGDIAELAEMIRRFGRGEDKILAHITPEEAAMLKEQGGRGTINPMTGLPEFQEEDYLAQARAAEPLGYYGTSQTGFNEAVDAYMAGSESQRNMTERQRYDISNPNYTLDNRQGRYQDFQYTGDDLDRARYSAERFNPDIGAVDIGFGPGQFAPPATPMQIAGRTRAELEETYPEVFAPTIPERAERSLEQLNALLNRYPNLSRIGGAGVNLVGQALLAQRANRERRAQAEAERARAQPFRQAEAEALARARGEGLTPRQAREMEIIQARERQRLSAANQGAGSAAAGILATQQQRARSVARQESFDEALKMAGIADRYERAAIAAELAADQELANIFSRVLANEITAATTTEAQPAKSGTQQRT